MSWLDKLSSSIYHRFNYGKTTKEDLPELVGAVWGLLKEMGADKKGFTKEDALVDVMEQLDANGCNLDLTSEEWDELARE